ncbi:MAG: pantoate--beta-alanine ligase [Burkholderiales bacterium]|nr:pantoate--beta-alanine ligase [Burkholderiales bacterium]
MKIITSINEIRNEIKNLKNSNKTIGFVPTMGYLHDGHLSLIRAAKKTCDIVIVSIFVNPLQFAPSEDLARYPRNLTKDRNLCINESVDIIFTPQTDEMIGETLVSVNIKDLSLHMCGKSRVGHFNGVCTIVTKFFNIIQPNKAFFGKKDIQQFQIIRKLVSDLNFDIEIVGINTHRDSNGIALSSRNSYLSEIELKTAQIVPDIIKKIHKELITNKSVINIIYDAIKQVNTISGCRVDYIEIVDTNTLQPLIERKDNLIIAVAIFIGKTRLIDNMIVE